MQKISAYILTFNEAEKIKAAIETVLWADEIVVVDPIAIARVIVHTHEAADLPIER